MPYSLACVFARAGTSRGAFLAREDMPSDPAEWDPIVLGLYGSPDPRQIDGIGGGDALTSKVAVVGRSDREDADVDYTFGQVSVTTPEVFWKGNCGNMSSGVGPFAIRRGLVAPTEPETVVRIFNTNTQKVLVARVQVADGAVVETGDVAIAGVPGTGAPIYLDFGDCGGAVTGALLPTGSVCDEVTLADGSSVRVSLVDATTPFVFVAADSVKMVGTESAADIEADADLLDRLEEIRAWAAMKLGFVDEPRRARDLSPSIPRIAVVSPATDYRTPDGSMVRAEDSDILGRQMAMQHPHKAYAVTGTLCTAVAASLPGSVVHEIAANNGPMFRIGHPSGVISARVRVDLAAQPHRVCEASLVRTARVILDGNASVPDRPSVV